MSDGRDRRNADMQRWSDMGGTFLRRTMGGVGSWLKAQVILFFINFAILLIGLALIGVSWWGVKALVVAVVDTLPLIGSGLIMIPWAIIRLIEGAGSQALWLIILWLVLIITRQIAEPLIVGRSIGVKPLWTFLATVIGTLAFGPIGAILGALAAIMIRVALTVWEEFNPRGKFGGPGNSAAGSSPGTSGGYGRYGGYSRSSGNGSRTRDEHTADSGEPAAGPVDPRRVGRAKDAGSDDSTGRS